jgi:uncharacterized repeat protein (TIGR01451 family)
MNSFLRRAVRTTSNVAFSTKPLIAFLLPLLLASSLVRPAAGATPASPEDSARAAASDDAAREAELAAMFDVDGNKREVGFRPASGGGSSNVITSGTYAFAAGTGETLEDMSAGTTVLVLADQDDTASVVTPIGFDFWYDGVRQTQFSVNANGLMRLGVAAVSTAFTNALTATANQPQIAPYWDDLWAGINGKVHYKVVGSAPNRKLVVEWNNSQVPRVAIATPGAGTFQAWLFESTGVIEFVYGSGIAVNTANSGYTIGLATAAASFAAVTAATNSVSYVAANDTQTTAIPSGTSYTFTPNAPATPGALSFTAVGLNTMTLNWGDTNANEVGYAIYRSVDGVNYEFVRQTAVDATSSVETGLASNTSWSWRVAAVTEGGVSAAASGSQATTTGTVAGTRTVGPTGVYASLGAAIADINTNGLAGDVILELQAAYVSGAETFPVVVNTLGSPTSSITIRPETGAAGLSITSAATQTLDLNGATGVIIDGRAGGAGASQLTIANTSTSGHAVRFLNGASRNTIRFATVAGVNTSTTNGVVLFGTSTGVTGNNFNTIDSCDVRDGATTPVNLITSVGTANTNLLNTGNTISNNNLFNFFSAGTATNGLLVTTNTNMSNTGWTVANNRIFQTASRTYTTGNTHRGIFINGGSNYSVTGNVVGFAAANGTGTYTMAGTVATGFTGIQLAVGDGPNSIQGNTVTAVSLTTSTGAFTGISLTSGSAGFGDITGNTTGSGTGNGAISLTASGAGFIVGMNVSGLQTGSVTFANNTIGSLTATGAPATANPNINSAQLTGGALTVTNNLIGSLTTPNSIQTTTAGTSATAMQLIGLFLGVPSPVTISGNTVANLHSAGTGTAHVVRGLQYQSPTGTGAGAGFGTIQSNTFRDISGANANATVGGGGTGIQAIIHTGNSVLGSSIDQNTIFAISGTNTGAVGTTVAGIGYSNPQNGTITRNRIYDIRNAATGVSVTAPPMAMGILIRAALGTGATFANNMISLGDSQTTNTQFVGMMQSFNTVLVNAFYNSVRISGTAAGGALPSYAFLRGDNGAASAVTTPVNIKNNIFDNVRTGGTGKHYAIGNVNSVPATGWGPGASDFNVLNSPDPNTVGIWGLAADQTFAGWKTASAGDASSLSGIPVTFAAPATGDLHLNMGLTPTPLESGGTVIAGITTDFDNQVRPGPAGSVNGGATAPDIGADEFDGVPQDITAPSISYTPLANTVLTTDRTVNATITDINGVAGGALAPRIYYRKNAGSYVSNQCGAPTGSVYPCTISHALVGGVVTGDVIDYFVVAQDLSGNVGANPAGGFTATDVNNVTSAPTVPNSYTIVAGITGTRTVCASGCDFATLTGAGGLFSGLNAGILTGNTAIEIGSDLIVGEDGSVALNALNEEPPGSNFTLRIYPVGAARAITSTTAPTGGFIRLNGADRVTIDGSIGGTGTDRSLTITDTNTGTASAVIWLQSNGSDGATDNTIQNVTVIGTSITATPGTLFGIGSGSSTVSITSFGTGNDDNTYRNNDIRKTVIGIYSGGQNAGNPNTGTVIAENVMNAPSPDNITTGGILVRFEDGIEITQNDIGNVIKHDGTVGTTTTVYGIALGVVPSNTVTVFTGNDVTNAVVTRNRIDTLTQMNSTGYSSFGIVINSVTSGTTLVANNMLSQIRSASTANDFSGGIIAGGGTGSTTQIYANSVSLTGTRGAATFPSYGLAINSGNPIVDVQNNIFHNTQTSTGAAKMYAIANASATFTNMTSHNNVLFVPAGAAFFIGQTGGLGTAGTDRVDLAAWQAATGVDLVGTISQDPLFAGLGDLHLQGGSPARNAGAPLASITVDLDGDARDPVSPDVGADEVLLADLSITKTDGVSSAIPGGSVTYTITASNAGPTAVPAATVADSFPAVLTCSTTCVGAGGGTCTAGPVAGDINDSANLPVGGSVTYTSTCSIAPDATGSLVNTATVATTGAVADSDLANNSATDTDTLTPSADLSITKTDGVTIVTPGASVTYTITASNAGPSAAPGSTVVDNFPGVLTCSTTCVGAGGGTCTAGPFAGNINDTVNLPVGGSVTYTSTCDLDGNATGSLVNTATVAAAGGVTDAVPGNNSATDTDTIAPQADLSITKDDGVTVAVPGGSTTYTIVASNAGPSGAATAAVVDNFPSACTSVSWTCSGSGGGSCTAAGSGNINQSVNLPSGGSVTFLATCNIDGAATGNLSNTATIGVGVNDPNIANNSSTDVDSLSNLIFSDGFESGDTSQWTLSVPLTFTVYDAVGVASGASAVAFDYDFAAVQSGEALAPTTIAFVTDAAGKALFLIGARRTEADGALELTLEIVGGGRSSWVPVGEVGQQVRFEWSAAGQSHLGHVAVWLDGRLALWVEGAASGDAPVAAMLLQAPAVAQP